MIQEQLEIDEEESPIVFVVTTQTSNSLKDKRVVICQICSKSFTNFSNYKYHMAHHKPERPWVCDECPKTFKTKIDLIQHQRSHDKEKPIGTFRCDVCYEVFKHRSNLSSHKRSHSTKGPQKCNICNKIFVNLRSHIRFVHQKLRQYICGVCSKSFGKKSGLDRHIMLVHEKQRKWNCDICDKACGEKTQLERHRRVHFKEFQPNTVNELPENVSDDEEIFIEGKKRMRCGICKKVVNSKGALKRHKELVHENKRNLMCDFCSKMFGEHSNLKRHIERNHKAKDGCSEVRNEKSDSFNCTLCGKTLSTKWGLELHEESCPLKRQMKLNKVDEILIKEENDADMEYEEVEQIEEVYFSSQNENADHKLEADDCVAEDFAETAQDDCSAIDESDMQVEYVEYSDDEGEGYSALNNSVAYEQEPQFEELEISKLDETQTFNQRFENEMILKLHSQPQSVPVLREKRTCKPPKLFSPEQKEPKKPTQVNDGFNCEHCEKSFKLQRSLERHLHTIHPELLGEVKVVKLKAKFLYEYKDSKEEAETGNQDNRTCSFCDPPKVFKKKAYLKLHIDTKHKGEVPKFSCSICYRRFSFQLSLERHVRCVHEKLKEFKCLSEGCDKSFGNSYDLKQHSINVHDEGDKSDRTCSLCDPPKTFMKPDYLIKHTTSFHNKGQTNFCCPICSRSFSFERSMNRHIKAIHEDRRDFKCDVDGCSKTFRSGYCLKEHFKNMHTRKSDADKPPIEELTCDVCEKVCSSKKTLYCHKKKVHEGALWGKNGSSCKLCKEPFDSKYLKNKHWAQVHRNGEIKMRTCHVCNSEFQLYDAYKAHIVSHDGFFICMICGHNFSDASSLLLHVESHRRYEDELRQFVCDICSHRLTTKAQLTVHMRKHFEIDYYVCDICGKSYKFYAPFLHHKKGHEVKFDFPCRYCEKQFKIARFRMLHERTHTNERPYKCEHCKRAFAQKPSYLLHLKTHEPKNYECKLCGLQNSSKCRLVQHEETDHPETRPHICPYCRKSFKADYALEAHKKKCFDTNSSLGTELN